MPSSTNAARVSDANDLLYQIDASRDYDPGPSLEKIRAPLYAINTADDFLDPPELGILEREIKRVPKGRAILIPLGPETRGHGTHTFAECLEAVPCRTSKSVGETLRC